MSTSGSDESESRSAPVSVIIPCYRCAGTIRRAVASVLAQTTRPREIVLIDDCSGDDTLAVLERIREENPQMDVRVISLAVNGGPGTARNAGWDAASQLYLAFLDADDAWHSKKIEIQYGWMRQHPTVWLTGHATVEVPTPDACNSPVGALQARSVGSLRLLVSNRFPTRTVMLRRDLSLRFAHGKRYSEDYLLWLQIVMKGFAAWRLELPLAFSFKADFGAGGLSGRLWRHEVGELETLRMIWRQGLMGLLSLAVFSVWSLIKYCRRALLVRIKARRTGAAGVLESTDP